MVDEMKVQVEYFLDEHLQKFFDETEAYTCEWFKSLEIEETKTRKVMIFPDGKRYKVGLIEFKEEKEDEKQPVNLSIEELELALKALAHKTKEKMVSLRKENEKEKRKIILQLEELRNQKETKKREKIYKKFQTLSLEEKKREIESQVKNFLEYIGENEDGLMLSDLGSSLVQKSKHLEFNYRLSQHEGKLKIDFEGNVYKGTQKASNIIKDTIRDFIKKTFNFQ